MKHIYLYVILVFSGNLVIAQNDLTNLKKGIYPTYADFYNNTPVLVDSIIIDSTKRLHNNWNTTYDYKLRSSEDNKRILDAWGFSDGANVFLFYQKEAWKLSYREGKYHFIGYGLPEPVTGNGSTNISYIDPSTGKAAGGGVESIYYFFDERKQIKTPTNYTLDNNNGRVKHKDFGYVNGTGFKHSLLHFYRSDKNEVSDTAFLQVGDSISYHFVPNSYHKLIVDVTTEPLKICLVENNSCFDLNLTSKDEWYFKVSNQSNEKTLVEVSLSEGEFYAFKSEKKQEKRLRKELKKATSKD